jgi:hypothetical protein
LLAGFGVSTRLYLRERAALREKTRLLELAEQAERISQAVFLTRDNRMEEETRSWRDCKVLQTGPVSRA